MPTFNLRKNRPAGHIIITALRQIHLIFSTRFRVNLGDQDIIPKIEFSHTENFSLSRKSKKPVLSFHNIFCIQPLGVKFLEKLAPATLFYILRRVLGFCEQNKSYQIPYFIPREHPISLPVHQTLSFSL